MNNRAAGPLSGVKVLDMTSVVMGPYATQILASMGADVVKVEPPAGDTMRHTGPMRHPGMGHLFLHTNQGKRSIVLDLKQPGGREAAMKLAEVSDVLISNVRPQALARLGLDHEAVSTRNPRIIHVSCCGFGQEGPYAAKPAYDDLIQGAAGIPWLMHKHGTPEPCYAPVTMADRVTGLHAAYAVAAALYERERSGVGQAVVVPMFEAMAQLVLGDHLAGLTFDATHGEPGYARLLSPHRRPYRTRDGYLCVLIYNDKHWKFFVEALGDTAPWARDERFSSQTRRAAHIDEVYALVADLMLTRTTAVWQAFFDAGDVPNMPMNSPRDLLDDPHLKAVGFVQEVDHPSEGPIRTIGNPIAWSTMPARRLSPAPRLGEHSVEVLTGLGYSADEIDRLMEAGASTCDQATARGP